MFVRAWFVGRLLCGLWAASCLAAVAADADITRLVTEGHSLCDKAAYAEADRVATRAAEAARSLAEDDVKRVYVDLLAGRVREARGDYAAATAAFEKAIRWLEESTAYGPEHPAVAAPLVNLATVLTKTRDDARAEQAARRAVQVNERHPDVGPDHPQTALALHVLAGVLDTKGDFAGAVQVLERTVAIKEKQFGRDSPEATVSLQGLASALYELRDYARAEPLQARVLANVEKHKGPDHPDTALVLNNSARLSRAMGHHARAEPLQQRAIAILERAFHADHPALAHGVHNMGLLLVSLGRHDDARKQFERAATSREKVFGVAHPATSMSWQGVAFAAAGAGDWAAALDAADRGRRGVRRHVARVLPALTEREQLQFLKVRDEADLHGVLSLGLVLRDDPAAAERSAGWLANAKAVGQEASASRIQVARQADDAAARQAVEDLAAVRRELAALRQTAPTTEAQATAVRLGELEERERSIILSLGVALPGFDQEDPWVGIETIRAGLGPRSVLVDIARFRPRNFTAVAREGRRFEPLGEARYVAWIVPPTGAGRVHVIDLGVATEIDALVAAYRSRIEAASAKTGPIATRGEGAAEAALAEVAAPLSKLVLAPLIEAATAALGGRPEEIVVAPDGPLWVIPYAALVLDDGRYAVEEFVIRQVVSGRDLVAAATDASVAGGVGRPLIMAAPNFDGRPTGGAEAAAPDRSPPSPEPVARRLPRAEPLPGTLQEAGGIAAAVGRIVAVDPEIVVGDEATEARFKATPRPALAVLATHGFFLPDQRFDAAALAAQQSGDGRELLDAAGMAIENPLTRCGLLLTGCNRAAPTDAEDGVLTGLEILGCDLRGTRLVMLSACQTGLGDVKAGEGVAGLRQAFRLAGADTVVSTLWSVPDRETMQLSNAFFAALASGETTARAIREAQLAQIKARRDTLEAAHPYFWAAFTVTGN